MTGLDAFCRGPEECPAIDDMRISDWTITIPDGGGFNVEVCLE
jgi:hypothetical protein